jgi:hypothetical protein
VESLASPHRFVCSDSRTYWTKRRTQARALGVELIAGRLAHLIEVGPNARPVIVPPEALPSDHSADHCEGLCVGVVAVPRTVNTKDLPQFLAGGGVFDLDMLNAASRARVAAFRAWIGAGDAQALIQLQTGILLSIDHGDALNVALTTVDPQMVTVPGVADDVGRDARLARVTIELIENVPDREVIRAVADVPDDPDWGLSIEDRLEIAEWLADRRGKIGEVMSKWATK